MAAGRAAAGDGWNCAWCNYYNFGARQKCRQAGCFGCRPDTRNPRPPPAGASRLPPGAVWVNGPGAAGRTDKKDKRGGGNGNGDLGKGTGGRGGGSQQRPPLAEEQRAVYMGMDDATFDSMAALLDPSERQQLRQARFLAKSALGELSQVKAVKLVQVQADEKALQLDKAKDLLFRRRAAAEQALEAVAEQEKKVRVLRLELDEAVKKAKAAVEEAKAEPAVAPAPAASEAAAAAPSLGRYVSMAKKVSAQLGDGAAAGPLGELLAQIAADGAKILAVAAPAAAPAAGEPAAEAAVGTGHAGGPGEGGQGTPPPAAEGADDIEMQDPLQDSSFWSSFNDDFCKGDPDKRKLVEELQTELRAKREMAKKQRRG